MSHLKLYEPPESVCDSDAAACVLPLRPVENRLNGHWSMDSITRARILHENRQCPSCGHPQTEPLELENARYGTGNLPIPGTATLVGFRCLSCDTEWPV